MSAAAERLAPARQLVVAATLERAVETGVTQMRMRGYRVASAAGQLPVVLSVGNAFTQLLGGAGLSLFPGNVGKRGTAVVDAATNADGTVTLTISHITGMHLQGRVNQAIEQATAAFESAGVLVDAGVTVSSFDLPASSPGNPKTFRASYERS